MCNVCDRIIITYHNPCQDILTTNNNVVLEDKMTTWFHSALQHVLDIWLQHLDKGKLASALFLDLSAGFDVINHPILLDKMKEYNFADETIKWFSSYLLDRSQCVQVESSLSSTLPVPWGIPQGSILGPLLFLLFVNELPDIVKEENDDEEHDETPNKDASDYEIVVYADDNSPMAADAHPHALQEKIQHEADVVTKWFSRNEMVCSSEKTKLLIVGTHSNRYKKLLNDDISLNVNVCGEIKQETVSEKLLGVIVNNTATFKHHMYGDDENPGLIKQLSTRVGMLKRLKRFLSPAKLRMAMDGLFGSKLAYGMTVWGRVWGIPGNIEEEIRSPSLTKEDMRKLQVLQNKCLRLLTSSDYKTPTNILLQKTQKLSVHQQVAYLSLSQVFSIHQNKSPVYHYRRLFMKTNNNTIPDTRTQNTHGINRVEFKLSLCRTNFFYQSSRLWSSLPIHIRSAKNQFMFKKKCKAWVNAMIRVKP